MNTELVRLVKAGAELQDIKPEKRDDAINSFFSLLSHFKSNGMMHRVEEGFHSHTFSYGNFHNDFIYASYSKIKTTPSLCGISQRMHQLLATTFMPHPLMDKEISAKEWAIAGHLKCNYGMVENVKASPYISTLEAWHKHREAYYADNQGAYEWNKHDDDFLPNPTRTNEILRREITAHGLDGKLATKSINPLHDAGILFHEEVAKKKGDRLEAYTRTIGEYICLANFYRYETELSAKEQRLCGSLRCIFSIVNRNGRKQYISLDFKHCMMEHHDEHGVHLGEYRFDGSLNSPSDSPSHDLKSLKG